MLNSCINIKIKNNQLDPKGSVPKKIVQLAAKTNAMNIAKLRKAMDKKYKS